jgi:P-type conjugative transfer protein TrbL
MNVTGMPQDIGFLTFLLQKLVQAFTLGIAQGITQAMGLLSVLTGLEILLMGIWFLFGRQIDLGHLVARVVGITVLGWIVTGWQSLTKLVIDTFIQFGLAAGGGGISQADFTDPSNIAQYGMSVAAVINQHLSGPDYQGMGAIYNLKEILLSGWLSIGIAVLYLILAAWIFVILLEFYGTVAFSVVLVPFGALRHTAFLAEKTFAALCASGVQVMALAFVTSVILPVMVALQGGLHPTLGDILVQLGGVIALGLLAWRINRFANVLTSGHPQLTPHDVANIAQSVASSITQAASGAVSLRTTMHHIAHTAAQAASQLTARRRP